jgi:hypothetical protein
MGPDTEVQILGSTSYKTQFFNRRGEKKQKNKNKNKTTTPHDRILPNT